MLIRVTFATRLSLVALAVTAALLGPRVATARLSVPARAGQLIVVSSATLAPRGDIASLRAYERTTSTSPWHLVLGRWPAETGWGHLRVARHEGDGSTPVGVFGFESEMYGTGPSPDGLRYGYHRLVCGDWWDEDPFSPRYNRFVHVRCGTAPAFARGSEALWESPGAYRYFAVLRFNVDPTIRGSRAPGSAIFLHAWVNGPTAGCVALPDPRLLRLLRWLAPAKHPVIEIGTDAMIGRLAATGRSAP